MNRFRVDAHHLPHTRTMLKLTRVEHASSSALGGNEGTKKKTDLPLKELLHCCCCKVHEEASLRSLTDCVTLVSGLRLDANRPAGTFCCVVNLHNLKVR